MTTPTQTPVSQEERAATVHATALALAAAWSELHRAQLELLRVLEKRRADRMMGSTQRLRATLQVFLDAVAAFDRTARAIAERWAARDLPVFYRDGAVQALERAVHSVQQQAVLFSWTSRHQEAITGLSAQFYTDLIARITEAVRRAHVFVRDAQAQTRRREGINRAQLLEAHPLDTVVYRDQSKHPVVSWATGSLTAQSATVTNAGALNYGVQDLEAAWFECVDNPECGFTGHGDLDKANGTIRSAEDASAWPVSHFACVEEGTTVQALGGLESAYRMTFSGVLVRVRTAAGRSLSVTPNHPMLTGRGWVSAGEVQEGDQVLCSTGEASDLSGLGALDLYNVPALVEDVFDSLRSVCASVSVVPSTYDFHGDAPSIDGEVDVVGAEGQLWRVSDGQTIHDGSELPLQVAGVGHSLLASPGRANALLPGGDATPVGPVGSICVGRVAATRANGNSAFLDSALQGSFGDDGFLREAEDRLPVQISLDQVIQVRYVDARCHVYDLSSEDHAYFANGILVHNCIRQWIPRPDLNGRPDLTSGDEL